MSDVVADQGRSLDELTLTDEVTLEELIDRKALGELAVSFSRLFGIPLRLFNDHGVLLAESGVPQPLYEYLGSRVRCRHALQSVADTVKAAGRAPEGAETRSCITGAEYRVSSIEYGGRRMGKLVLGPYVPVVVEEPPSSLYQIDPELDAAKVADLFDQLPRAGEDTIRDLTEHLGRTLDLILFSGHRALLTTRMHLLSVRESYRELSDKAMKLQQTYDKLKEADRLKSNFLATVSHELRTPLTSIIGYSEMLIEGMAGDLTSEQRDFVSTIHGKGEQLLQLIKGLLDLAKLDSGTMSVEKSLVAIDALLEDAAQTVVPVARKKGIRLDVHVERGLPELWADAARLRQVLLNLLENALKFTPQGGELRLSAGLASLASEGSDTGMVLLARRTAVQLRVADSGPGVPEGERTKVFDAFYQVDSSATREHGGTGLGLSIVKRLVEAHDGTVHIEDNRPRGAVFVVTLPYRRASMV